MGSDRSMESQDRAYWKMKLATTDENGYYTGTDWAAKKNKNILSNCNPHNWVNNTEQPTTPDTLICTKCGNSFREISY